MKKAPKKVIIVTGPSGSGKSSLAGILARRGYRLVQGDQIARGLYAPSKPAFKVLRRAFGPGIIRSGRVDRKELGRLVFSSPAALKKLNAILHPVLIREIRRRMKGAAKAVVDMAVYFSAGAPDFGGALILVDAPLKTRVQRLKARGLELPRALSQARGLRFSPAQRRACDAVIVNQGTKAMLLKKLDLALGHIL